jgi:hypothetical protein
MSALGEFRRAIGLGALGASLGVYVLALQTESLRAAGLNGTPPPNAGEFKSFIGQMTDNAIWIVGTSVLLGLVLIGGLFLFGHSRAQDYAAKVALGVGLIILAPGIAA